ncbi:MAG: T9SS type A sorting domain-containing protein [bacterium]|nr:T9SS type A sorting domain-containing protein [bacterium]
MGDTIVTSYTRFYYNPDYFQDPTIYTYRVFLSKTISPLADTIRYLVHDVTKSSKLIPTPQGYTYSTTINSKINSFYVTNLNDTIINFKLGWNGDPCGKTIDSTYNDKCGFFVHSKELRFRNDSSCQLMEPPIENRLFIEGIGFFYYSLSLTSLPRGGSRTDLVSAHKVGKQSCEKVGPIPNGIGVQQSIDHSLFVYPNPNNGVFEIESFENATLMVMDILGKQVCEKNIPQGKTKIDLQSEPAGLYFLILSTENRSYSSKIIKQ